MLPNFTGRKSIKLCLADKVFFKQTNKQTKNYVQPNRPKENTESWREKGGSPETLERNTKLEY